MCEQIKAWIFMSVLQNVKVHVWDLV